VYTERRRYVDSEDDDGEESAEVKPAKKSSQTVSKPKETAPAEHRVSRTRQNGDVSTCSSTAEVQKDEVRKASGKSGRLSLSKENQCIDEHKQVHYCYNYNYNYNRDLLCASYKQNDGALQCSVVYWLLLILCICLLLGLLQVRLLPVGAIGD